VRICSQCRRPYEPWARDYKLGLAVAFSPELLCCRVCYRIFQQSLTMRQSETAESQAYGALIADMAMCLAIEGGYA
jgi:hypothetical protein